MERRIAFVTGAGAGIGAAIAERLAEDGHHVIASDRDVDSAKEVAAKLTELGYSAESLALDVGDTTSIDAAFDQVEREHGRCDILVNNAGVATTFDFLDFPVDHWERTLRINVTGPFHCSRRAARLMRDRNWGRIVNISSVSGLRAGVGRTAYGTSKSALNGLTRQIAVELAPFGITANAVAPGPTETALAREVHTQTTRDELCRLLPGGQYGSPASIAAAVSFLASEGADFVNGQVLPVDGGMTAAGVLRI
ncbi:SDR family NAD(P)-dependent oxidoreductase [Rhodococcus indonesiensis]|uniref:SDR family NAD(P)-dependent oxidoreductase n=1 Tax=Rhodococcus indonesiensis TaxID=3055869 RepID=UPI0039F6F27E